MDSQHAPWWTGFEWDLQTHLLFHTDTTEKRESLSLPHLRIPRAEPLSRLLSCLGHSFNQQGNNGAHKQTGFEQQQQLTVQQSLSRMTFLLKTSWAYPQSIGAALGTHTQEQNSSPPMGTLICRLPALESPTVRTEDTLYTV